MQFNNAFLATIVAAIGASSTYAALVPRADPTCGTTGDATLVDCQNLVNSEWSNLNYERTCTYAGKTAYNPICHPGNCCVYVTVDTLTEDDVKNAAKTIVSGCASQSTDTVNGVINVNADARVCIGNGDACGDFASFISLTLSRGFPDCENGPLAHNLVCNPDAPSLDRAKAVVAEFTLEELIANTGNDSPGVPRLGLAPYNWWNEALHGFGGSPGSNFSSEHGTPFSYSTSFPAPILMSAAFDDDTHFTPLRNVISTEGRAFHNFNRSGIDFWALPISTHSGIHDGAEVKKLLERILYGSRVRDFWGLGDDQWIVGDCAAVEVIYTGHGYTEDIVNASALALKAGVDIDCGTTFPTYLGEALEKGLIAEDDIKKALVRQYHSLVRTGYFDPPSRQPYRQIGWSDVNTKVTQELAYRAAVDGMVLLKNDGTLPLSPKKTKVALIGPFANATRQMQSNYAPACAINTTSTSEFPAALDAASEADVIIYIGGMDLSVEDEFRDREEYWVARESGRLADVAGKEKGKSKKLVVVSMGGGQVDCSWIKKDSRVNALLWAGLPSQSGGTALLDILTGKKAPAGRLPVTQYPAGYVNEVPMTDMGLRPRTGEIPGRTYKWYTGKPGDEFGFGLHYTKFDIAWEKSETDFDVLTYNIQDLISTASNQQYIDLAPLDTFTLSVTNAGRTTASDFVALLFVQTKAGPQPTSQKELVAYTRVKDVQPGQSTSAELTVTLGAIARTDENGDRVLYPGEYELLADWDGKAKKKIRLRGKEERLVVWPQPPS
ncbi:hypothetical protein VNI00_010946 [Paramarasmius palmivorus]|uniref:Fibronectin type III-like domain-containing protein n=1 Tax=Paramarasmius palmivorus TaxID=297713 RepID=A0AAW0CFL2_9AGAR